jgi:hypothetical protein
MIFTLTKLQYAIDPAFPLRGYVYGADGMHRGAEWLATPEALQAFLAGPALKAMAEHREVRVTDGGDMMVLHARDGKVLFPGL